MLFNNERNSIRNKFFESWQDYLGQKPLGPLEQQLVHVMLMHPEYHPMLENPLQYLQYEYLAEQGEVNPFLHMGLHLGLLEQISTNRPAGITALYQKIVTKIGDLHTAEHMMMECLAEIMWETQKDPHSVDEEEYLERIRRILG